MRSVEVASDLRENCGMGAGESLYTEVGEVKITFPYHDVLFARWDDVVPTGVWENFQILNERLCAERLDPRWVEYLGKLWELRSRAGCKYPIDLLTGVFFVIEEHPRARKLRIPQFDPLPDGWVDFRDFDDVTSRVNSVMGDKELRDYLTRIMTILIPDGADSYLSRGELVRSLLGLGVGSGLLLEIGCGVGHRVKEWSEGGFQTVGVERQYHPTWYGEHWKFPKPGVRFVRGDGRTLPIAPSVVDVVALEYFVGHVTDLALTGVVDEAGRVVRDGGLLIAGPQSGTVGEARGWRGYRSCGGEWTLV